MDEDKAGQGAISQICKLSQAVKCIQVPLGKDVNEFYRQAGYRDVIQWINYIVEDALLS